MAVTFDELGRRLKEERERLGKALEQLRASAPAVGDTREGSPYGITLDQGVRFVIDRINGMQGGEIFVPKIPSMKITDLADAIAPGARREVTGIRPGEKVNEILLTEDEARHAREFEHHFVIEPEHPFWGKDNLKGGKALPEGFRYTSDNNTRWLTKEELQKMIEES